MRVTDPGRWPKARVEVREAEHDGMALALPRVDVTLHAGRVAARHARRGHLVREAYVETIETGLPSEFRVYTVDGDVWVVTPGCGCNG